MRIEFADDELRRLFAEPDFVVSRFGPDLVRAYRKKVAFLSAAESELDLRAYKALHFEKLVGNRDGQHSIRLNRQWRVIVRIETDPNGQLLIIVEIVDYH